MKTNYTRTALTCIFTLFVGFIALAGEIRDFGSNTTYNINRKDTLRIVSGRFTGNISSFHEDGVIVVSSGAVFNPNSITNPKGRIFNYGNMKLPYTTFGNGVRVENFGIVDADGLTLNDGASWSNKQNSVTSITNGLTLNGTTVLANEGTLSVGSAIQLNTQSVFTNTGKMTAGGALNVNIGTSLINEGTIATIGAIAVNESKVFNNKNTITTKSTFTLNTGTYENTGVIQPDGALVINSNVTFTNRCKMITSGGLTNNGTINNQGMLWVGKTGTNKDFLTNNGTINNSGRAVIRSVDFTNYGSINGDAQLYFEGKTVGGGTFGKSGATTDSLLVYDVTRTSPSRIFDEGWGTIHANTVYRIFEKPDSMAKTAGCSNLVSLSQALPVHFTSFQASVQKNVPQLTWTAMYEPGMRFEIERSTNGKNFAQVASVYSNETASYQYKDAATTTGVVYYRIKGLSLDGDVKFTEVKTVKLAASEQKSFNVYPNPTQSVATLSYAAKQAEKVQIIVRDANGKMVASKMWTVTAGSNQHQLTEISDQSAGVYFVELTNIMGMKTVSQLVKM
ncbi:T9SS type A sorting domain-containing protein [Pseudocnuella soli]|uniref:T9SS type A sorting domain-containing protein n=1 Tax=Pseudocnuella soli TaxID=2502779 RepID=UPI0010480125|nr:T9SS type A sorting domain-containing protein [Pseudocnuella soli]